MSARRSRNPDDRGDEAFRALASLLAARPGPPFRQCERIGLDVADFFCPAARLAVLIENENDPARRDGLAAQGHRVLSFTADAVLHHPDDILAALDEAFTLRVVKR